MAEIRKQQGLTQAALAQMAGVSTSSIAMYETNRRQPDTATIHALAKALKVRNNLFGIRTIPASEQHSPIQEETPGTTSRRMATTRVAAAEGEKPHSQRADSGWTNLALSRDEARFILFMRMHPDSKEFLSAYMNADDQKRKQIEKAMRLIQAFQS